LPLYCIYTVSQTTCHVTQLPKEAFVLTECCVYLDDQIATVSLDVLLLEEETRFI